MLPWPKDLTHTVEPSAATLATTGAFSLPPLGKATESPVLKTSVPFASRCTSPPRKASSPTPSKV